MEMKKVYATLRALLDVLENLVGQSPTDRLHRQILEEVIHGRIHDLTPPPPSHTQRESMFLSVIVSLVH